MDVERVLDRRLTQLDPAPVPLAPVLAAARAQLAATAARLARVGDGALERPWEWKGEGRTDVRSGIYLAAMELQGTAGRISTALAAAGHPGSPVAGPLAAATRARWDLHGVLGMLERTSLESDPGSGEWDLRQTLGHLIESQRGYAWFSAWWLQRAAEPGFPAQADERHGRPLPAEDAERSGSMADLRARLDALLDLAAWLWLPADEATLATPARWSGFAVTLGFRLHRWAAHIAEHTIQVDKTLALLGHTPTEVERLHRLLHRAYGDLEATVFGLSAEALETPCEASRWVAPSRRGWPVPGSWSMRWPRTRTELRPGYQDP